MEHQATQLKVAYEISRLIHADLDLDSTLDAIARSLVSVAGFAGATLSVDTLTREAPVHRLVKAGFEPPASARVTRNLEVHGERIGDITLSLPVGSNLNEANELMDYVIPTIEVDVAVHEIATVVEVAIKDSGVGIPENEIPHIFNRYYQGNTTGHHKTGGTGIGLALAKELAEIHRGTVRVSSAVGVGTEFVVSFPLGRAHLTDSEFVEQSASRQSRRSHHPAGVEDENQSLREYIPKPGRGLILIIDDDADVRQYIKDIVAPYMQVVEAADGEQGIQRAQQLIPDLIISDIETPATFQRLPTGLASGTRLILPSASGDNLAFLPGRSDLLPACPP